MHPNVHSNVHSGTVYDSQYMEATQVSINRRMDKDDVVYVCIYTYIHTHTHTHTYIYNGILLSHKKEQNSEINYTPIKILKKRTKF